MEFRHPKYYKELRKRNKETQQELQRILDKPGRSVSNSDQVISDEASTEATSVHPCPGLKPQATEASSLKPERQALSIKSKRQAKRQASSIKPAERQASSD